MSEKAMTEPITIMGIKGSTLAWGLVGGATAAAFGPGTLGVRFITAAVGTVSAGAFGPLWSEIAHKFVNNYFGVHLTDVEPAVHFLCGLTGMLLCSTVLETCKRVRSRAPEAVDDAIDSHVRNHKKKR